MAQRSLRASQAGIARAENALTDKGWSRQDLADRVVIEGKKTTTGISIQTVHKFLTAEKVDRKYFVGICRILDLPWNEIEESAKEPKPECPQPKESRECDIDVLVGKVRQKVKPYIQERCGTMRVLDMNQPISLGEIYTSVNILEKITGRRGVELTGLMRDVSPEKFARFCLGDVRERRVPGLEAIETFSKLMILGKPGAGKTTFLKHLAIQSQKLKLTSSTPIIFDLGVEDVNRQHLSNRQGLVQDMRSTDKATESDRRCLLLRMNHKKLSHQHFLQGNRVGTELLRHRKTPSYHTGADMAKVREAVARSLSPQQAKKTG